MIKMLVAATSEIDDPEVAVTEILAQLDPENLLLANSLGLIACYYEFMETEVVRLLCERLPFEVIGCTTMGSAVNGHYGLEQLSLAVLTSDDVRFATAFSDVITGDNVAQTVEDAYRQARAALPGEPSFVLALPPLIKEMGGDIIVKTLDRASGGLPVFGALSNDTALTFENCRTIYNGDAHRYKMALALMYGEVKTDFFFISFADRNIQGLTGIVTESSGYTIKRINNIPAVDYLAFLGVNVGEVPMLTIPLMVDYGDGTKSVTTTMYSLDDKNVMCGIEIPESAKISIGEADYNSVMDTAESAVNHVLKSGAGAALIVPCIVRSLMISPNSEDEMKMTTQRIGSTVPFWLCYAGGEICPAYGEQGHRVNRFHNMTYALTVLS
jgi:hypothetical protein